MLSRSGFCSALCLVLCWTGAVAAESEKRADLRLGSDVWPPFTDVAGKPRVAIDLVEDALRRAGIGSSSDIRDDFSDLIEQIRAGKLDGSAALWYTAQRETFLRYSKPYLENRLVLVGRRGSDVSAQSFGELTGRRIAIVDSYAYGEAVDDAGGPVFVKGPSDSENMQRLLRGEVDYVLADELVVFHLFQRYEAKAKQLLQVGPAPLLKRSLHFALRRDLADAQAIIDRFDAEIRKMVADGSYNRALQMDWILVDVDGDGTSEMVLEGTRAGAMPPGSSYEVFEQGHPDTSDRRILDLRYMINGQSYDSWDKVPVEYKIPSEHGSDPAQPGIVLFEF